MNGRSHFKLRLLSAAFIAVALSGTAVHAQSPKEGGGPEPVVLDLVIGDGWNDWTTDLFIGTVDQLSGGRLQVRLAGVVGEQDVAGQVQSGEADIGQVFARGFESIGAKGFQALMAPFVVTDADTLTAIATGPIGADMLAELKDHGLEGLIIRPGERRFVVGLGRPVVSLDDFAGAKVDIPRTASNDALVRALGAEPVSLDWGDGSGLKAAGVDAVVTSIGNVAFPDWVLTSNLAIHTVPLVWFANAETMAQLSPEDQEVIRAAAQAVQDSGLEALEPTESTTLACAAGAPIVEASDEDVAAIVSAAQPLIDELATDPTAASFIDRIAELKAMTVPAPFPAPCDGAVPLAAAMSTIPDGTYTATVTPREALEAGYPWANQCSTAAQSMLVTLVIEGSDWTEIQTCEGRPADVGAVGSFEYTGDTLVMTEPGIPGQAKFAWSADDSSLSLSVLETVDEYAPLAVLQFLYGHEFTKAGSEPASAIPDGTYTATVTPRDSLRTGAPWGCDRTVESAVVTLMIQGSDWTQMGACGDDPAEVGSRGILEYVGDSLIMREPGFEGQVTSAWSADDTSLTLKLLEVPEEAAWPVLRMLFEHEFTRAGSGSISAIPDGTYTATVTPQDALRTGWPWVCAADVESMDVTFVVDGADWTEIQTCDGGSPAVGSEGTLEYAGDTLAMGEATYRWSADDTSLTLEVMETTGGDPLSVLRFLFEHTFTRTPD